MTIHDQPLVPQSICAKPPAFAAHEVLKQAPHALATLLLFRLHLRELRNSAWWAKGLDCHADSIKRKAFNLRKSRPFRCRALGWILQRFETEQITVLWQWQDGKLSCLCFWQMPLTLTLCHWTVGPGHSASVCLCYAVLVSKYVTMHSVAKHVATV